MLKKAQDAVEKFTRTFGLPVATSPKLLEEDRVLLRSKWMREEIEELVLARSISEQADAAADIIYFALGIFVEMGVPGDEIFEIVHNCNMKKVTSTGAIVKNEEGKVQKPLEWRSPESEIQQLLFGPDASIIIHDEAND